MWTNRTFRNNQGFSDIIVLIGLVAFTSALVAGMMTWNKERISVAMMNEQTSLEKVTVSSGADTFLIAFRFAERTYMKGISSCDSARPFIQALSEGSGCPVSVTVFSGGKSGEDPGLGSLYSYPSSGCTISEKSSNCVNATRVLVSVGETDATQQISGYSFRYLLTNVWTGGSFVQFKVIRQKKEQSREYNLAIRGYFTNAAHLDNNLAVIQESPAPNDICPGSPWGLYEIFMDSTCKSFVQLGGGTGLAYYKGRFFGFRPADGIIVDLQAAASKSSYVVNYSNGKIAGDSKPVFVPYPNPGNAAISLVNVDDITLIEDQIYYVAFSGESAHIGYVDTAGKRTEICPLGKMGWGQAYAGIGAASWSDTLISDVKNPLDKYMTYRYAQFFLKTDSGDFLSAIVFSVKGARTCYVMKDENLQQIEFSRTLGFDRTADEKPYYIF